MLNLLPVENFCGLLGSALLLFTPVHDQVLRHLYARSEKRARDGGETRRYWEIITSGYDSERNAPSFLDSITMAMGAIFIGASYVINAST